MINAFRDGHRISAREGRDFKILGTNVKKKDQHSKDAKLKKKEQTQEKRNKTQEKRNTTTEKRYKIHKAPCSGGAVAPLAPPPPYGRP